MRQWAIDQNIATAEELDKMAAEAEEEAKEARKKGWEMFQGPIKIERDALVNIIGNRTCKCHETAKEDTVDKITEDLSNVLAPIRKDNFMAARKILRNVCETCEKSDNLKIELHGWLKRNYEDAALSYDSFLYNGTATSVLKVKPIAPVYSENSQEVPGKTDSKG